MRFQVQDPDSGQTVTLEGDSPPTEQELEQVFSTFSKPKADIFRGPTDFEKSIVQAGSELPPEIPRTGRFDLSQNPIQPAPTLTQEASQFGQDVTSTLGNVARAIPADVAAGLSLLKRPENQPQTLFPSPTAIAGAISQNMPYAIETAGNIPAALAGEPLPIDKTLSEAATESVPAATVGKISQGIAATAPMAIIGVLPAAAQKAALLAFTAKMISDAPEVATQLGTELGKPKDEQDPDKISGLVSDAIQITGFSILGGTHLAKSGFDFIKKPSTTGEVYATQKGVIPESRISEYQRASEVGTPTETGGGNRVVGSPTSEALSPQQPQAVTPVSTQVHPEAPGQTTAPKVGEPAAPAITQPGPGIVGMGGATPSELTPTPQTATGIKNATVDIERSKRGLPPAIEPVRRTFGKVWDDAMAKIDNDPGYPERLIDELRDKPRALTDAEDATLLHRQIDLQNEYGKATRDLAQAYDDGRMEDVGNEQARVAGLSDQLLDLYNVGKSVGTETGRGLAARRMMAYEDFTLSKMELEKRVANEGRPLTEEQRQQVVKQNEQIQKTQKAYDDYVQNTDTKVAEQEGLKAINEIVATTKKERGTKKPRTPEEITADEAKTKANIKLRLDEGKRSEISGMVQKLARMFVERGVNDRNELLDSVHGVLKEIDPEFTRRETMDAISGYGDFRQLTKDEISLKLRDLKGQMQQVAKLEDMQAGKPPLKTGMERRIPSPEESRLIKLVNEAKNQFQIPISDEATQLKSSLDTLKTRLKNRTIELQGMLERKEFAKKPKRIIQRDAEANRLHFEMTKAKKAWYEALMQDRMANRNLPQKIFGTGAEILNTSRAVLTSMDLSAVLRQGGFIAFGHPIRALKSFPAMFRAFASEAGQHAVDLEISKRPNFPLYNQSKLYLSEHGQTLAKMEEAYMSRWADKIPLVAGSQRAYVTFLNKLRADSFDAMANSLARSKELTPNEAKAIANFVNVSTGRGNFGMKENALVGLNTAFFAPRYVASRFQLLAGQPLYRGTARTRLAVAKEYGRFLGGLALVYALANMDGATVDTDPRSSDFGKLRYGNTRIDPMAGLLQSTVLLGRLGSGETKTAQGKVIPIRGEKVPYGGSTSAEVVGRFLRSKLSPALGTGINILSGKDVVGQPVTAESTAKSLLIPLSLQDIASTMQEQGFPRGSIMGILSIFGMGLQNYQNKTNKPQTPVRRALVQQ